MRLRARLHRGRVALQRSRVTGYYRLRYLMARATAHRRAVYFGSLEGTPVPDFHYTPWKVCALLGAQVRPLEQAKAGAVRWAWSDSTHNAAVPGAINGACTDI